MINKNNVKLGVGTTLLIAALSMSGCSMNNTTPLVTNGSSIETTIDSIENIKDEEEKLKELQNKLDELIEKNKSVISNSSNKSKSEEKKEQTEQKNDKKEIVSYNDRKEIFIPEYNLDKQDDETTLLPEYTLCEEYFLVDGTKWVTVPKGYVLFSLNDDVDIDLNKEENDVLIYQFAKDSFLEQDTYFAVRKDLYEIVRAANNVNFNIVHGFIDNENIIELEKGKSIGSLPGVFVPKDYFIVDSNSTDKITNNDLLNTDEIPIKNEYYDDKTLYYRLDAEPMDSYYGISNKIFWFYKYGMNITNDALNEIKTINEENTHKV